MYDIIIVATRYRFFNIKNESENDTFRNIFCRNAERHREEKGNVYDWNVTEFLELRKNKYQKAGWMRRKHGSFV